MACMRFLRPGPDQVRRFWSIAHAELRAWSGLLDFTPWAEVLAIGDCPDVDRGATTGPGVAERSRPEYDGTMPED